MYIHYRYTPETSDICCLNKSFSKLTPTAQLEPLETLRASPRFQDVCQDDSPSHCDSTPTVALLACRFGNDHG